MHWGFMVECSEDAAKAVTYADNKASDTPLVTVYESDHLLILVVGRLYYRQDWRDRLSMLPASDAHFAGIIYEQLGPKAMEEIEGDFTLALVDKLRHRLFAMRDPMGAYPLYWLSMPRQMIVSTGMAPLLERFGSRSINYDYIADYLLVAGSQSELPSEYCVYQGINRLLPGSILSWSKINGQVRCRRYWNWLNRLVYPDNGVDIVRAGEAVREVLQAAVNERLVGRVATHLSGGMDSTAVAMLANKAQRKAGPLHTISLVFRKLESLRKETPYIETALASLPGTIPHVVEADNILDFDAFRDPPPMEEPYPGLWRLAMDRATIESAIRAGASTLMTGLGADEIFHMEPFHLADLMRHGRVWQAWREAGDWAYTMQWNVWQVFQPFAIQNLFPAWSRLGFGRLLFQPKEIAMENGWTLPPWINTSFARRYDLRGRSFENARRIYAACRPTMLSVSLNSVIERVGNALGWALAAPHGLAISHPFFDNRVLRVGLGLLTRIKPQPEPLKPVLALATSDLLPEMVRTRRNKGHFNEPYYLGLSRNTSLLETTIWNSPCEELGLVHKPLLAEMVSKAALGSVGVRPLQHFNLMVGFLKWLEMQENRTQMVVEPCAVYQKGWNNGENRPG